MWRRGVLGMIIVTLVCNDGAHGDPATPGPYLPSLTRLNNGESVWCHDAVSSICLVCHAVMPPIGTLPSSKQKKLCCMVS